jgi:hypothetical protein
MHGTMTFRMFPSTPGRGDQYSAGLTLQLVVGTFTCDDHRVEVLRWKGP